MLCWRLILTKPAGERIAAGNLERQGYRIYYPRLLRPIVYRGKWADRTCALFPRYLFLQADTSRQSIAPVRSTPGVAAVVRFGNECAVVPDAVVDGLMDRADPESGLHRLNQRPLFARGAAVNIVAGAFEGLEGIFERAAGDERVVVLLRLLGRETRVNVPGQFVLPSVA